MKFKLIHMQYSGISNENVHSATATVSLANEEGIEFNDAATGVGPVNAVYQAINRNSRY